MRVYELAKELNTGSHAVLVAAAAAGMAVAAPSAGLSEAEAETLRGLLTAPVEAVSAGDPGGGARGVYRLVRKGSVRVGSVVVRKGQVVDERVYGGLPGRVKPWFDRVAV